MTETTTTVSVFGKKNVPRLVNAQAIDIVVDATDDVFLGFSLAKFTCKNVFCRTWSQAIQLQKQLNAKLQAMEAVIDI